VTISDSKEETCQNKSFPSFEGGSPIEEVITSRVFRSRFHLPYIVPCQLSETLFRSSYEIPPFLVSHPFFHRHEFFKGSPPSPKEYLVRITSRSFLYKAFVISLPPFSYW